MKPLIVLIIVTLLSFLCIKFISQKHNIILAAKIGMTAMLFFTAVSHFIFTKGMVMMIPTIFPLKTELVYLTAILEITLGIGLLIPFIRVYCAWVLIVLFLCMLPANINSAIKHIDYQKATFKGSGISYLWFRVPLQLFFIVWTYLSSIKMWYN